MVRVGHDEAVTRWCILRTAGPATLRLAKSLAAAGFEAWTPTETQARRLPRSQKRVERESAVMPSYVFAPSQHVRNLLAASMAIESAHPAFHVFRHLDRIPLITTGSLAPLRDAEDRHKAVVARRRRLGERVPRFPAGASVRVDQGAFAGLDGIVTDQRGRAAFVTFPNSSMVWEIDALLLISDVIEQTEPTGIAA